MEREYSYLSGAAETLVKPLIHFEGRTITRSDFLFQIEQLSRLFFNQGVRAGERVILLLENSPELLSSVLAIQKLGATAVPLNPGSAESEWRYAADDTQAVLLLSETSLDLSPQMQNLTRRDLDSAVQAASHPKITIVEELHFDPAMPALICYTSGTTSRPKGVVLSHANVFSCLCSLKRAWRLTEQDRLLLALPLFHVHGLIVGALGALWNQSEIVLHRRFDAARALQDLDGAGCTLFMGVPTMFLQLLTAARERHSQKKPLHANFRSTRLFISGSAPLPAVVHREFEEIFQQKILERYGMTETLMVLSNPYDGERKPGSVGFPLPGVEVKLVGDGGRPVAQGDLGEIWVRGPAVFREYWNQQAEARDAFCGDWFKTGDVAYQDTAGYFFIAGRKSMDIIKSSGFKISAREIEERLLEIPCIKEVAVVGIPDSQRGEQVVACIRGSNAAGEARSASAAEAAGILQVDLGQFLSERLAGYKHPVCFVFLDALPRNPMGKVSKIELKKLAERLLGSGQAPP